MRTWIIALLWLPLVSFAQDSLNVRRIAEISIAAGPELGRFTVSGNYLFAPEGYRGLHIVDISDPAHPREVSMWETDQFIHRVAVRGDYAYVTDYTSDGILRILDISNLASPVEVAQFDAVPATTIEIQGDYAFVTRSDDLHILNISNPTVPVVVGSFESEGGIYEFTIEGNLLYLTTGVSGQMRIVDISDVTAPVELGNTEVPQYSRNVAVSGNRAYVTSFDDGLQILDVSDPTSPQFLAVYDVADQVVMDVDASGDFVFLADKYLDLRVLNVSNPLAPNLVGYNRASWYSYQVVAAENIAYINDAFGVAIFDVSQALPVEHRGNEIVEQFDLSVFPNPFNSVATITFDLPREVTGRLVVYDALGREAAMLMNGRLAAGSHRTHLDGSGMSSGAYFVKLDAGEFQKTQKIVLMK